MGDVEEPVVRRAASERCPQPLEIQSRAGARVIGEATLEVVGHGVTSRRSRRRPALTFCRAASSLMPIRAPISA